jgi:DNA-binding response OmpR family regulator
MLRILVVEDDPAVRLMLDTVLSGQGHWVQTAPNAREATAFVLYDLPQEPDLAILDLSLPGIGGLEYAEDLRRHFPSVRLIFMTGWQDRQDEHERARQRAPLLLKPFPIQELLTTVASVIP